MFRRGCPKIWIVPIDYFAQNISCLSVCLSVSLSSLVPYMILLIGFWLRNLVFYILCVETYVVKEVKKHRFLRFVSMLWSTIILDSSLASRKVSASLPWVALNGKWFPLFLPCMYGEGGGTERSNWRQIVMWEESKKILKEVHTHTHTHAHTCHRYDTKLHSVVKFQLRSSRKYWVILFYFCHYSQVHAE